MTDKVERLIAKKQEIQQSYDTTLSFLEKSRLRRHTTMDRELEFKIFNYSIRIKKLTTTLSLLERKIDRLRLQRMDGEEEPIAELSNQLDRLMTDRSILQKKIDEIHNKQRDAGLSVDSAKEVLERTMIHRKEVLLNKFNNSMSYYDTKLTIERANQEN